MGDVWGDWGVLCDRDICALVIFFLVVVGGVFLKGLICIGNKWHFRNKHGNDDNKHQF